MVEWTLSLELTNECIVDYQRIVILTGAGVSAESGLATFRTPGGLWEKYAIKDVATPEGYATDPERVYHFYNACLRQLQGDRIRPNPAHQALARLEQEFDGELLLITQNIDDLHEQSGSRQVIHMHGYLRQGRCPRTGQLYEMEQPFGHDNCCCCCQQPQPLRPHVVWFGEQPLEMAHITRALEQCDLFVAIGTSGKVYPAAGFVGRAHQVGADTLLINLDAEQQYAGFRQRRLGKATKQVPLWVEQMLTLSG